MPLIDTHPDDRFKPGDIIVYQQAGPDDTTPRESHRNGTLVIVIGRYDRFSYKGENEAYQLKHHDGTTSAYYTKLCELATPATILGDDDSDCI